MYWNGLVSVPVEAVSSEQPAEHIRQQVWNGFLIVRLNIEFRQSEGWNQ